MSVIRVCGIKKHSFVDGPGTRFTLFTQGCPHHCQGCHNPETWNQNGGIQTDTSDIIKQLHTTKYLDGLTLSGGDPLLQAEAVSEIAAAAKEMGLNVWAYTGWTWEELVQDAARKEVFKCLPLIDVLVDGRFEKTKSGDAPIWRGSSNQRLIDVKKSLQAGKAILYTQVYQLKAAN